MSEMWGTFSKAQFRVCYDHPSCGSFADARERINEWILGGKLRTRYRVSDGEPVEIPARDWRPGREGIPGWYGLEWDGWDGEEQLRNRHREVVFEIELGQVQELCAPSEQAPARRKPGPKTKPFAHRLAAWGTGWINAHGEPTKPGDLVDALRAECERRGDWEYGKTQLGEIARDLIAGYKAGLPDD